MSLFEALFGKKPPVRYVSFSTWEDTTPPELETLPEPVAANPVAAWPFPTRTTTTTHDGVTVTEEAPSAPVKVNVDKIAAYHAEQAAWRRAEKARLKEIVQTAPEHGIEFVHVGTTTFAWRYHSVDDETNFVRNKLLIDISTAVCNPSDQFAKWHGSAVAAERMLDGQYITLRIASDYESPREALLEMGFLTLEQEERRSARRDLRDKQWSRIDARANEQVKRGGK